MKTLKRVWMKAGPWIGARGEASLTSRLLMNPKLARTLTNFMLVDGRDGAEFVSRPGSTRHTQMGSGSARKGQCIYDFQAEGGTRYSFRFLAGKVYRWNQSVSGAVYTDVTPTSGCTISTTARIHCCTFNDELIVSDGVNRPWRGTNLGAANITATEIQVDSASTAWAAYGAPFVNGAKLGFIRSDDRETIYWSEEFNAALGYDQNDYDNSWTLSQTSPAPLYAVVPTNQGFYYFRDGSIGFVSGLMAAEYRTTANHDAVSTTVGCTTPASVSLVDDAIYFCDRMGRPHRLPIGGTPEPIWEEIRGDFAAYSASTTAMLGVERNVCAAYFPEFQLVLFALPANGADPSGILEVWSARSGHYLGQWLVGDLGQCYVDAIATVRDANGVNRLAVLGASNTTATYALTDQGYPWVFGTNRDGVHTDNSTAFSATLTPHYLGLVEGEDVEYYWDYLSANVSGLAQSTATVTLTTSRGSATLTGTVLTETGSWQLIELGLERTARWLLPKFFLVPTTQAVRITKVSARATPLRTAPGTP